MKSLLFAVMVTHIVTHAHSIEVTYGGTGCPGGSAQVEIDELGMITLRPSEYSISRETGDAQHQLVACGESAMLRLNTSLLLHADSVDAEASSSL
mgnify:CR=1 FL=1